MDELNAEIARLEQHQGSQRNKFRLLAASDDSNNMLTIDKHFVSGFDTTSYEDVLPQLRPDLFIDGDDSDEAEYFPNASRLRMIAHRITEASAYVRFLSNVPIISGITPATADKFASFERDFSEQTFDLLKQMGHDGRDIPKEIVNAFLQSTLGESERQTSLLKTKSASTDLYLYFRRVLLNPKAAAIWADGSGGYMPFTFGGTEEGLTFFDVQGNQKKDAAKNSPYISIRSNLSLRYTDPEINPMSLYQDKSVPVQTPWYPIFRYNKQQSSLLYMQFVGSNIIVYGRKHIVLPVETVEGNPDGLYPKSDYGGLPVNEGSNFSPQIIDLINDPMNSFMNNTPDNTDAMAGYRTYALHFPGSTPDVETYERFRVHVLPLNNVAGDSLRIPSKGFIATDWRKGYAAFNTRTRKESTVLMDSNLKKINICDLGWNCADGAAIVLLPINKRTVGDNFEYTFRWGSQKPVADLVKPGDYSSFDSLRYLH
jgi:hypothetical protein